MKLQTALFALFCSFTTITSIRQTSFSNWRYTNKNNSPCGFLPNLWNVQMGNFRVDFAHNKRKAKVFVAKITPNQCDEFVPRRGKYSRKNFLAKRKNIGYAVCKPRIGKWVRKGKIKSRCSDQMVSYSTVAPPKEVMAMYSDKDFQPL